MTKKGRPKKSGSLVHEDYPTGLIEVAKRRTWIHLHSMRFIDFSIPQLLVNVYCQGIRDAAESLANNPNTMREMLSIESP